MATDTLTMSVETKLSYVSSPIRHLCDFCDEIILENDGAYVLELSVYISTGKHLGGFRWYMCRECYIKCAMTPDTTTMKSAVMEFIQKVKSASSNV